MRLPQALTALALLAPLMAGGCSEDKPSPPREKPLVLLNRGVMQMDRREFRAAIESFTAAVEQVSTLPAVWVNLGLANMNTGVSKYYPAAESAFLRALELEPDNLRATYSLGILYTQWGRMEEARPLIEDVLERVPGDWGAAYNMAKFLMNDGELVEAERLLRRILAEHPHFASAHYALSSVLARRGAAEARKEVNEAFRRLQESGTGRTFEIRYNEMGPLAEPVRSFELRKEDAPQAPGPVPRWKEVSGGERRGGEGRARPVSLQVPASMPPAAVLGPSFARRFGPGAALADVDGDGDLDLYVAAGRGPGHILLNEKGRLSGRLELPGSGRSISGCFGDVDNDLDPDLYVACAGPNLLLRNDGGRFTDITTEAGAGGGSRVTSQAVLADLDADGDLDIYCANMADLEAPAADEDRTWPGDFPGAPNVLLNNDRDGGFSDITERTGTGGGARRSAGVLATDLDRDHDADLLVLNHLQPDQVFINDRIWRFREQARELGLADEGPAAGAWSADLDRDGDPDILRFHGPGKPPVLLRNRLPRAFSTDKGAAAVLKEHRPATGAVLDANNDGRLDVILAGGSGPAVLLGLGDGGLQQVGSPLPALEVEGLRALLGADLDGDGAQDLVASRSGGDPVVLAGAPLPEQHRVLLGLQGKQKEGATRSNAEGVGAWVELVAGTLHQHLERVTTGGVLGGPSPCLHFGLGTHTTADYVRITWPDDVIQAEPELSADQPKVVITQVQRKSSSCPLLFTWDGERWRFVTDFLGTGGLGFFLEPGLYAPPDPTELVKVPVLEPRKGAYELRIHEPMEEILYLDEAGLLVVDHPAGTEVWPDERMAVSGPDPSGRLLCIRPGSARYPQGLATREGPADAGCLRHADRIYQPGVHPDPRFLGYAEPQEIVLDFGDALRVLGRRRPLFLFLEGWVEYPYSHINFAAWQAGLAFEALSLDVEVSPGRFEPAIEGCGYPAGMPRMMTLDVTELRRDGTGRIRLRTNIELYLDRVFLAEDLGAERLRVHELAPQSAELRRSGYPREYSPDGRLPLLYDYGLMDPAIAYKTMEGAYTRFGDVTGLLQHPDDRYVIMGRAEEVAVRYPVPPRRPGTHRSFVLRSYGWCKDMDLYTAHPHTVGPLPHSGMSTYPPDVPYPAELSAWRLRHNTRWLHGSRRTR